MSEDGPHKPSERSGRSSTHAHYLEAFGRLAPRHDSTRARSMHRQAQINPASWSSPSTDGAPRRRTRAHTDTDTFNARPHRALHVHLLCVAVWIEWSQKTASRLVRESGRPASPPSSSFPPLPHAKTTKPRTEDPKLRQPVQRAPVKRHLQRLALHPPTPSLPALGHRKGRYECPLPGRVVPLLKKPPTPARITPTCHLPPSSRSCKPV